MTDPHHCQHEPKLTEAGDPHDLPLQSRRRFGVVLAALVAGTVTYGAVEWRRQAIVATLGQQSQYEATLIRAIDGDTIEASVRLGFGVSTAERFRVAGVDTPEIRGGTQASRQRAKEAKQYTHNWCVDQLLTIHLHGTKTFDRWVADIFRGDGSSLAESLIESGYGVSIAV